MRQQPNSNNNTARCVCYVHTPVRSMSFDEDGRVEEKKEVQVSGGHRPFFFYPTADTRKHVPSPWTADWIQPNKKTLPGIVADSVRSNHRCVSLSLRSLCLVEGQKTTIRSSFDEFLTDEWHTQTNSRAWNFGQNHRRISDWNHTRKWCKNHQSGTIEHNN